LLHRYVRSLARRHGLWALAPPRHPVAAAALQTARKRSFAWRCVGGGSQRPGVAVLCLAAAFAAAIAPSKGTAQEVGADTPPIRGRNIDLSRAAAAEAPRSESDQVLIGGWPLYRTERGQGAFNDAMATLKATEGAAPPAAAFQGCANLRCNLSLPRVTADGWIPSGRIWMSPTEYLLIAHSPRLAPGQAYRRRAAGGMRYFVLHEFQNSSRNTDLYDTISAHDGSVFVPLYMSKPTLDANGRRFVIVVQVAPYDVVSIHASNRGSAGPGMEVAKNPAERLEPLQGLAGVLIATMVKAAAPHLQVVNHQDVEGLPMLNAYEARLAALRAHPAAPTVALPFVPAPAWRVAAASGELDELIERRDASARVPIAERAMVSSGFGRAGDAPPPTGPSPVAAYLHANLAAVHRTGAFAAVLPRDAADVAERSGSIYVLDAGGRALGRIEPYREHGVVVSGTYVYAPFDRAVASQRFDLDLPRPASVRAAWLTPAHADPASADSAKPMLVEPLRPATRRAATAEPLLVEPIRPAMRPVSLSGSAD